MSVTMPLEGRHWGPTRRGPPRPELVGSLGFLSRRTRHVFQLRGCCPLLLTKAQRVEPRPPAHLLSPIYRNLMAKQKNQYSNHNQPRGFPSRVTPDEKKTLQGARRRRQGRRSRGPGTKPKLVSYGPAKLSTLAA